MIHKLSHTTIYVTDQDAAKSFYVDILGFDLRMDASMPNGFRWLTVSPKEQPDLEIILMKVDGPNLKPETAAALRPLLESGQMSGGVLMTSNCQKTYEELSAKGVEFTQPPVERFYGVEALMKDNSGNWFSLTQPKGPEGKG